MKQMIGAVQERIGADQEETKLQNIKGSQERIDANQAEMEQKVEAGKQIMVITCKEL